MLIMILVPMNSGAIASAPLKVSGNISCGDQYHFHMETQVSVCTPNDLGGMDIKATTQWQDSVIMAVSQILGVPESRLDRHKQ